MGRRKESQLSKARKEAQQEKGLKISGSGNALLIQIDEKASTWYKVANDVKGRNDTIVSCNPPKDDPNINRKLASKYRSKADELFRREVQLFGKKNSGDKDMNWIQSTISKGTLKDRIAAMSVVVSSNPLHKFPALDGLLQIAGCLSDGQANSRVAQLAAEALEDLFLNTYLPHNRKLVTLAQRPLHIYEKAAKSLSPKVLLLWRFEELVQEKYQLFLSQYIGYTLRETTEQQKIPTVKMAANLLKSVPEGESTLLSMICNKLGDPARKVASAAAHELHIVLNEHPAMQSVVAREVQQLAHRPHLVPKALYNCINFLNQLQLTPAKSSFTDDESTNVKRNPDAQKSLPASLISTYFRLFEVTVKKATKDDDTNAMKGRLLTALLAGVNRAHPYLPAKDQEMDEHVDALYRVVYKAPPAACTQALLLLFHLAVGSKIDSNDDDDQKRRRKPPTEQEQTRQTRFYECLYSRLSRMEMIRSGKHLTMLFNLIYKAMKYDRSTTRVIAYAKLLLSTTMHCGPPIAAAAVFLLHEVAKYHRELQVCFSQRLDGADSMRFLDYKISTPELALVEARNDEKEEEESEQRGRESSLQAPMWEISMLLHHHHPSVVSFAQNIEGIDYPGDPLKDFALAPFLDKFAYRNPKTVDRSGKSQAVAGRHVEADRKETPVNDPSFLAKGEVAAEDEFFHRFFAERAKREEMKGVDKKRTDKGAASSEVDAIHNIESKDFESYEQDWDTDEEEEAFVDGLTQKMIEDSMDANELGPGDLDDEDPDMEGWDDMYDDDAKGDSDPEDFTEPPHIEDMEFADDSENDSDSKESAQGNAFEAATGNVDDDDDDAFMDGPKDDSDSDDPSDIDGENPFAEASADDQEKDKSDEDDAAEMALLEGEDMSSDEESEKAPKKKRKKEDEVPVYASVTDFEEKINDEWFDIGKEGLTKDSAVEKKMESNAETQDKPKKHRRKRGKRQRR